MILLPIGGKHAGNIFHLPSAPCSVRGRIKDTEGAFSTFNNFIPQLFKI